MLGFDGNFCTYGVSKVIADAQFFYNLLLHQH